MTTNNKLIPPASVRGMTKLDKDQFRLDIKLPCLHVEAVDVSRVIGIPVVRQTTLQKLDILKPLVKSPDFPTQKSVLFDPERWSDERKADLDKALSAVGVNEYRFGTYPITLDFDHWDMKRIFESILPEKLRFSGFSQIGHIVHCNLIEELLPYKFIIGEILLNKVKSCKTVVNKLDSIDNEFRNFKMELLAGEDNFVAEVKEAGCRYRLDFSKVFWNSRLSTEHERLSEKFPTGSVVYDVFAGVGPFVIPAAKRGKKRAVRAILANDLNPDSVKYLRENVKLNNVAELVTAYNLDGAEFIRQVISEDLKKRHSSANGETSSAQVAMNLPAIAVTFLPNFIGILNDFDGSSLGFPVIIHCYLFSKIKQPDPDSAMFAEDAKKQVRDSLKCPDLVIDDIHHVRNVAPNKEMMCVSFEMPFALMKSASVVGDSDAADVEPVAKRMKEE
uniref:tRNA (guanine(37)-N1)-methyltransferase n=1 Tax=Plectus sambesii TaxID=2011161 RepID=A0A914WZQ0_9BILA